MTRLIGPGKNEFVQAKIQARHAKTPEGKLMSNRQRAEIQNAELPPSHFVYQSNVRNLSTTYPINI